jgi:hypothetical protein
MKKITIGLFASRKDAEKAINHIHNELGVDTDDISYVYRNTEGHVTEIDAQDVSSDRPSEGAKKGAVIGGTAGALAGVAAVAGIIPGVGPLIAAGALASMLGLTAAVGTAAVGAAAGAAAGGILGGLINLGVGKERAQEYTDRVNAGDVLVSVHSDVEADVAASFAICDATSIDVFNVEI